MKIIHYTIGYGGKLNYHTICGKEIHSHDEKETATIDTTEVTCSACKKTKEWKQDNKDYLTPNPKIKYRIYIESDILSASEVRSAQMDVQQQCKDKKEKCVRRVFNEMIDHAWHHLDKTWEAVKKADEIYANSSLLPLSGGSYMGAPVIFNGMCERAIKENVTGKSVIILRRLEDINWYMIKVDIMKEAFKGNKLIMYNDDFDLVEIDVTKIKKK